MPRGGGGAGVRSPPGCREVGLVGRREGAETVTPLSLCPFYLVSPLSVKTRWHPVRATCCSTNWCRSRPGACETLSTPLSPQAPHLPQRRLFLCLFNRGGGRGWLYLPLFFLLKNTLSPGGSLVSQSHVQSSTGPRPCTAPRPSTVSLFL